MQLKSRIALAASAVVLLAGGFYLGRAQAGTNAPGTPADPLVTKSYVDQALGDGLSFRVVNVPAGQKLVGGAGTEIVLRGGKAKAIGSPQGGMLDATAGVDLAEGTAIVANHMLVVPRADGRGIWATVDVVALVRGSASVVAPQ